MVKLSFVQGRLSSEVAGRFQYFPIHNWKNEFYKAKELGFDGIEWIVSDLSNPIFDPNMRNEIIELVKTTGIEITSINLDLLMYKTLEKHPWEEICWIFDNINLIADKVNLNRVTVPVEETSGIKDAVTASLVTRQLQRILDYNISSNYLIAIETDLSPAAAFAFLSQQELSRLFLLVDIGNIAAYGYKLDDYFKNLTNKICSLHIKDRTIGIGPTLPLGEGSGEFHYLKNNIHKLDFLIDIVLQTFKTSDNYLDDLISAKKFVDLNILSKDIL
jgi:sugar phosphate isomerase/epimerase